MSRQSNKCSLYMFLFINLLECSILTIFSKPLSKISCRGRRKMELKTLLLLRYLHNLSMWICTYLERVGAILHFWCWHWASTVVVALNYTCKLVCYYTCYRSCPELSLIKNKIPFLELDIVKRPVYLLKCKGVVVLEVTFVLVCLYNSGTLD